MHYICVNTDPQNIGTGSQEFAVVSDGYGYPIDSTDPRWVSTLGQTISFPGGGRLVVWGDQVSLSRFPLCTPSITRSRTLSLSLCATPSITVAVIRTLFLSRSLPLSLSVSGENSGLSLSLFQFFNSRCFLFFLFSICFVLLTGIPIPPHSAYHCPPPNAWKCVAMHIVFILFTPTPLSLSHRSAGYLRSARPHRIE